MALNLRRGLKDLVAKRKGSSSKDAPQTLLPPNPPLPPLPFPLDPNLQKKKRKGRLFLQKQQKTARDRRASSIESKTPLGSRFAVSNALGLLG